MYPTFKGAYISESMREWNEAIRKDDDKALENLISKKGLDVNERDSNGRTPLHLTAYCNAHKCAVVLFKHQARISSRMSDGIYIYHSFIIFLFRNEYLLMVSFLFSNTVYISIQDVRAFTLLRYMATLKLAKYSLNMVRRLTKS